MSKSEKLPYGVKYLYLDYVVPVCDEIPVDIKNPLSVPNPFGAVGFEFFRVYKFTLDTGEKIKYQHPEPESYFWGEELKISDIKKIPGFKHYDKVSHHEKFVLTSWGAIIPIDETDIIIPYPELVELPANMRYEG